jgi:HNH endonuclease
MLGQFYVGEGIESPPWQKSLVDHMAIPALVRQRVINNAQYRCEYCKTSSKLTGMPLTMEHIQPQSLGGSDDLSNLAAVCYRCNEFKGANVQILDPVTGESSLHISQRFACLSNIFQRLGFRVTPAIYT